MNFLKTLSPKIWQSRQMNAIAPEGEAVSQKKTLIKKIRGGFLILLGYALSPLCWWNDLIFNLPIAYGFGYLCRLISPTLFLPGMVLGYWLSNIIGILVMQAGFLDMVQGQTSERNLKKELLTGVITSTLYTAGIVLLLQFKILETPLFALTP